MRSTFCFSKDLQIILYGVNRYAEELYVSLTDAGYAVTAYFDRRYEELKNRYPIPVYGLKSHPFTELDKSGFCVVIMLQNAMQHEAVALELLEQGFHKILFVPMRSCLEEETALELRYQYNALMSGQFQMLCGVPLLEKDSIRPEIDAVHAVIRHERGFKIVWCPAELLYTNPARVCKAEAVLRYANVPLYSYAPYVKLFEYLQGKGGEKQQYLNEYGVNSCKYANTLTDDGVLIQRRELLEIYQNALNNGVDFFISSAPPAEWNAAFGVFNLLEGQHRSLFLVMREFKYIPIRISQEDYEKWGCSCEDAILKGHLKKTGERVPILHPKYHKINERADRNHLLQLESIQKYLSGGRNVLGMLAGKRVLDLSGTFGYYARNALRMRAEHSALYAPEGVEIAREIHALEGLTGISAVDVWGAPGETYHTLFVLNALAEIPKEERLHWMDRCAALCLEECFVTVQNSSELKQWQQRFSRVRQLRTLFDRGQLVHLCVLQK